MSSFSAASHLTDEQLLAFALGRLEASQHAEAVAHVTLCVECAQRHGSVSALAFEQTTVGQPPAAADHSPASAPSPTFERGTSLGRYVLIERLGAGAMGEVFAAYDPNLDRRVALKVLKAGALSTDEGHARLLREAQALARLAHPNVIAVHDVDTAMDRVFVAMEYLEGQSLGEWMTEPHSESEVVQIFLQAGAGLAAAHKTGLVHRDFKPDNVFISTDGRVRVLDFGLARPANDASKGPLKKAPFETDALSTPLSSPSPQVQLTQHGTIVGTPGYMSPEQLAGLPTDARSDQFSFCAALFEALCGVRPFAGATLSAHALEIEPGKLTKPLPEREVSNQALDIVKRGLSAKPGKRWPDMDALLTALRPKRRRRLKTALGLVALAVVGTLTTLWTAGTTRRLAICGGQEKQMVGIWDKEVEAQVRRAFMQTGLPKAAVAVETAVKGLNEYQSTWTIGMREVCEAAQIRKTDAAALTQQKTACLSQRLARFKAVTFWLQRADKLAVSNGAAAVAMLEPVSTCFHTALVEFANDQKSANAQIDDPQLEVGFDLARVQLNAGNFVDGERQLLASDLSNASGSQRAQFGLLKAEFESMRDNDLAAAEALREAANASLAAGDARRLAVSFSRLSVVLSAREEPLAAEATHSLALTAASKESLDVALSIELTQNHGVMLLNRRDFSMAALEFEKALKLQRAEFGIEHSETVSTLRWWSKALVGLNRFEEAVAALQESTRMAQSFFGAGHSESALSMRTLGEVQHKWGRTDSAHETFSRAWEDQKNANGESHPQSVEAMSALAQVALARGDRTVAMTLATQLIELRKTQRAWQPLARARLLQAEVFEAGGDFREALALYRQLTDAALMQPGADAPRIRLQSALGVARVATAQGEWASAQRALDDAATLMQHDARAFEGELANVKSATGKLMLAQSNSTAALTKFQEAAALRMVNGFGDAEGIARDWANQANALSALGRHEEAVSVLEKAVVLRQGAYDSVQLRLALGKALWASGPTQRQRSLELLKEAQDALSDAEKNDLREWAKQASAPL